MRSNAAARVDRGKAIIRQVPKQQFEQQGRKNENTNMNPNSNRIIFSSDSGSVLLGVTVAANMDVFGKVPKGGGHFRSKKLHCRFCWFQSDILVINFEKNVQKGGEGGSSPIQKISLQIYAYLTDFLEKNAM